MQWLTHFNNIEKAIEQLIISISNISRRINIETKLRVVLQCYLKPLDTLIYRFILEESRNLRKNKYFVQLAETYLYKILKKVIYKCLFIYLFSLLDNILDYRTSSSSQLIKIH